MKDFKEKCIIYPEARIQSILIDRDCKIKSIYVEVVDGFWELIVKFKEDE